MNSNEIREELKLLTIQFESDMQSGKTHSELVMNYRKLKELQYEYLKAEIKENEEKKNLTNPRLDNSGIVNSEPGE